MRMSRLAIGVTISLGFAWAAQAADPPQYNGIFEARDPHTGAYSELERATSAIHTRMRGLGFGGAEVTEDIAGVRSPVRFRAGMPIEFVVRDSARDNDPNATIQFVALTSGSGARYFETYSAGGFSGMKSTASKSAVQFSAAKFGDVYFKIAPTQPLPPGDMR